MTNHMKHFLFALIIGLLSVLAVVEPAQAGEQLQARPANLTIEPLRPYAIGEHPVITVQLTAEVGQPIPNQPIIILVDGVRKGEGRTDSRGIASITLKFRFAAGTYNVQAYYPGIISIGVNKAVAEAALVVEPSRVAIYTVPPLPYVKFKLNNKIYTANENGIADVVVNASGVYNLEILPLDQANIPSNTRIEFARWNDNVFTPTRVVYFPRARRLEAGFTVSYHVDQEFYDTKGNPVDPARVSSMTVRGVGSTFTFDGGGPQWLPANRLTRRVGERLQSEPILYYFREIIIDGANVVNKGEQRFSIRPNDVWPIQVLLYSAHFSARDAMFGFPIGRGVELTYPDGRKEEYRFNAPNAEITIPSLARGSYSARIFGAGGSAPPTPVHVSRDQNITLLMLSYLDLAVIIGVPLLIALAFFFIGRPYWLGVLRHPSRYKELLYENRTRDASLKS